MSLCLLVCVSLFESCTLKADRVKLMHSYRFFSLCFAFSFRLIFRKRWKKGEFAIRIVYFPFVVSFLLYYALCVWVWVCVCVSLTKAEHVSGALILISINSFFGRQAREISFKMRKKPINHLGPRPHQAFEMSVFFFSANWARKNASKIAIKSERENVRREKKIESRDSEMNRLWDL